MKVVINTCFGGFGLSHVANMRYAELKGTPLYPFVQKTFGGPFIPYSEDDTDPYFIYYYTTPDPTDESYVSMTDLPRDDPCLVQVVEELGDDASGTSANLKVVEISDDVKWTIEEYDGTEWVAESHRTWR